MSLVSQDSAVHLHSEYKGHSFKEASVHILGCEDRLQEDVCVHCEKPSLNRGDCLLQKLSATYNVVLTWSRRFSVIYGRPSSWKRKQLK